MLSCGTAMHPQQQQMLLHSGSSQPPGLCFAGHLSIAGNLNTLPAAAAEQAQLLAAANPVAAAAAMAAGSALLPSQQQQQQRLPGPECHMLTHQQVWQQLQESVNPQQQQQQQQHIVQQDRVMQQHIGSFSDSAAGAATAAAVPAAGFDQTDRVATLSLQQQLAVQQDRVLHQDLGSFTESAAGAAAAAVAASGDEAARDQDLLGLHQQHAEAPAPAATQAVDASTGVEGAVQLQRLHSGLLQQQQSSAQQQQQQEGLAAGAVPTSTAAAAAGQEPHLGAGIFPMCAEELLNELLLSVPLAEQQQQHGVAAASDSLAAFMERSQAGADVNRLAGIQLQPQQQQQQQLVNQLCRVKQEHSPQPVQAPQQQQQQQQQQPGITPRAGFKRWTPPALLPPQQQQQQQQHLPSTAIAAAAAAAAGGPDPFAAAAAAMLAARGRALGAGYTLDPVSLCGFEVPEPLPAIPAAVVNPTAGMADAGGDHAAGGAAAAADPFAAWAHRFVQPAAGGAGTAGVLQQLGSALQLELPDAFGVAGTAPGAAGPDVAGAAVGVGGLPAQLVGADARQQRQRRGSSGSQHRPHGHHHSAPAAAVVPVPAAGGEEPVVRKLKRRFPLKRPSRLAAQQAAAVAAAAAAAAGFSECHGSCGPEWAGDAGIAAALQLEQQKRRRLRRQLHAAAAAVGDEAVRIISASSRVGGGAGPGVSGAASGGGEEMAGTAAAAMAAAEASHGAGVEAALKRSASVPAPGVGGPATGSPTSRPRGPALASAFLPQQQQRGLAAAAAAAAEGEEVYLHQTLQQTYSSMGQRQPAFSVPGELGWATQQQHQGYDSSAVADGCRSYASEPGMDADAAVGAVGSVSEQWGDGCSAAVGQWQQQLLRLQHQGLVTRPDVGVVVEYNRHPQPQQQQQQRMQPSPSQVPIPSAYRHVSADGCMPSPRAAAVLQAAAAGAQAMATPAAAAAAMPSLSPQLLQLQQQLQLYLQRNRDAQEQAQQQLQQLQPALGRHHGQLSVQMLPVARAGSGDLDHAVPGSPGVPWCVNDAQQQQQQRDGPWDAMVAAAGFSVKQEAAASKGPAAADAVQGSAVSAARSSSTGPRRDSEANSPKAAAAAAVGAGSGTAACAPAAEPAAADFGVGAAGASRGCVDADVHGPGVAGVGVDIGDLDLPAAPPELDAMLTAMLQEQHQQQQQQHLAAVAAAAAATSAGLPASGFQAPAQPLLIARQYSSSIPAGVLLQVNPAAEPHTAVAGPAAGSRNGSAAAAAATQTSAGDGGAEAGQIVAAAAGTAAETAGDAGLGCFAGGNTGLDTDVVQAAMMHEQEQLRQELTEASAGLQGLWLNPDITGCALGHSPTGLGFSIGVSQAATVAASPCSLLQGAAAGEPALHAGSGSGGGVVGWLGPGHGASNTLVLLGPSGVLQGSGGTAAAAGAAGGLLPELGSPQYMDAAAAAAGMPSWSAWHEEQQHWLDDIFSSGPTLPHEP